MELEGVSNLDLPNNRREYRSIFHDLDPQGVYSFLYIYDLRTTRSRPTSTKAAWSERTAST
jgi:hypothetical protein